MINPHDLRRGCDRGVDARPVHGRRLRRQARHPSGHARRSRTRRRRRSAPSSCGVSWPTAAPSFSIPVRAPSSTPATFPVRTIWMRRLAHSDGRGAAGERGQEQGPGALLQWTLLPGQPPAGRPAGHGRPHQCAALPARDSDLARARWPDRDRARWDRTYLQGRPDGSVISTSGRPATSRREALRRTQRSGRRRGVRAGCTKLPLPEDDFNRRIVLFGREGAQARKLAEMLSKRPWHNLAYFPGSFETLAAAVKDR